MPPQQQQPPQQTMGGNPFDPPGATQGGGQQPQPAWNSNESVASAPSQPLYNNGIAGNPYGAPPPPPTASTFVPLQQQQQRPPPAVDQNPFLGGAGANNSLVVSNTPSNPYAMPPPPQQQQLIVSQTQQASPWGLQQPPQPQQPSNLQYGAQPAGFDPFAAPPAPPPMAPAPPPVPQQLVPAPVPQPPAPAPARIEAPPSHDHASATEEDAFVNAYKPAPDSTKSPEGTTYPPQLEFGQKDANLDPPDIVDQHKESPRNKYASELAKRAPPGASPLPKASLVRKKGFILSRISFRTIVMKKWKQSYWVQYGPHTMLWFRSQADFDDWLNNPYHQQNERNFLIKLAVNFVHDLYKPNVRGYQVTQCRTKGYGNKMVRQFKLERWMDYGPTIAAAFGSYNPAEVDALREAVVECMRNTPLNGGIRATGAVRQRPSQSTDSSPPHNAETRSSEDRGKSLILTVYSLVIGSIVYALTRPCYYYYFQTGTAYQQSGVSMRSSFDELPKDEPEAESVAEPTDLLDINNWDDVKTEPVTTQQVVPYGGPPAPYGGGVVPPNPYGAPPQAPYGGAPAPHYGAPPPVQQPPPPAPQPYGGAPSYGAPPPPQHYGAPPPTSALPPQANGYPVQQQQNPWGTPSQPPPY